MCVRVRVCVCWWGGGNGGDTCDRILSLLGALFLFCIHPLLFHFAPCGCLSLASWYFVHILASTFLRAEEEGEEGEEKGEGIRRALNICTDVQEPLNCRIRRTFMCSPAEGRGKRKGKAMIFFPHRIGVEFIPLPSEDTAAGRRAVER